MRRALAALVVTVAAVWWLAGYDTHPPSPPRARATPAPPPPIRAGNVHTATGPATVTPFSVIQVQATLTNGRLTGVKTVELSGDGEHTQQLNAHAEPLLRRRALRAGGTDFDAVSGATYTSESYKESLQEAIDLARKAQ